MVKSNLFKLLCGCFVLSAVTALENIAANLINKGGYLSFLDHYTIFLLISHGILIDLTIITAIGCKGSKTYITSHEFEAIILTALIIIETLVGKIRGISFSWIMSFDFDMIVLISLILEIVYGYKVYNILTEKNNGQYYNYQKKVHSINSCLLLFMLKAKFITVLNDLIFDRLLFFLVLSVYFFLLAFTYSYFIILEPTSMKKANLDTYYTKHEDKIYKHIIETLKTHDFDPFELKNDIKYIKGSISVQDIEDLTRNSHIKWFLYGSRVVEIDEFPHPGGDFIISKINHLDITKFSMGILPFLYLNKKTRKIYLFKQAHGKHFDNYTYKNCFGHHFQPIFKIKKEHAPSIELMDLEHVFLLQSSDNRNYKKRKMCNYSAFDVKIEKYIKIEKSEFYIGLISHEQQTTVKNFVDLTEYWLHFIGKYLMLSFQIGGVKMSSSLYFLNPNYQKLRNQFLKNLETEIYNLHIDFSTDLMKQMAEVEDSIKNIGESRFCVTFLHFDEIIKKEKFQMSDFMGFGIGSLTKSGDSFLFIVKNQGILPFIDLFELIFQKILFNLHGKNAENKIFGSEYALLFANSPKINIAWVLDEDFVDCAQTLGLYHLQLISKLQDEMTSEDQKIIQKVFIKCPEKYVQKYDKLNIVLGKFSKFNDILGTVFTEFDKIMISGDDQFVTDLFEDVHLSTKTFEKIVFL